MRVEDVKVGNVVKITRLMYMDDNLTMSKEYEIVDIKHDSLQVDEDEELLDFYVVGDNGLIEQVCVTQVDLVNKPVSFFDAFDGHATHTEGLRAPEVTLESIVRDMEVKRNQIHEELMRLEVRAEYLLGLDEDLKRAENILNGEE